MKNIAPLIFLAATLSAPFAQAQVNKHQKIDDEILLEKYLDEAIYDDKTLVTLLLNSCGWIIRNEEIINHKKEVCLKSLTLASRKKDFFADDFIVGVAIKRNLFPSEKLNPDALIKNGLNSSDKRVIEAAIPFIN